MLNCVNVESSFASLVLLIRLIYSLWNMDFQENKMIWHENITTFWWIIHINHCTRSRLTVNSRHSFTVYLNWMICCSIANDATQCNQCATYSWVSNGLEIYCISTIAETWHIIMQISTSINLNHFKLCLTIYFHNLCEIYFAFYCDINWIFANIKCLCINLSCFVNFRNIIPQNH